MQQFIVEIHYLDYALDAADAVALLQIAARARRVERPGYAGPYVVHKEQGAFVSSLRLETVLDPEPAPESVDRFTAAARALSAEG